MAVVFCFKEMCLFQSIYEPNFRYTGARVCHFMCIELKDHPVFGDFKMEFLKKWVSLFWDQYPACVVFMSVWAVKEELVV